MTNLTFTDIKEINTSSEKLYSTKLDNSSVDKSGFLKIFEKANKDTNFNYDYLQNSNSNEFNVNNSTYNLNNNVTDTVRTDKPAELNNQSSDFGAAKKQDSDIKTVSQDQERSSFYNSENKVKQSSDNKADKAVSAKKEEKINNTADDERNNKKETKVSDKKEIKSNESKNQLESRIQLAALMHANITVPKVTDFTSKAEKKSEQNNSAQNNNVTTKDVNKILENTKVTQNNNQNSQFRVINKDFQLLSNNQSNNVKSAKEDSTSDKNVKSTQNLQENKKLETKTADAADTLKDNKKIEVLIQSDHPEVNVDNLKQGNTQLSSSTQKDLNDIFHKAGAAKPVITKLEVSDNLSNASSGQKQKQNLLDGQSATLTAQQIQTANNTHLGNENTITFDKVMDAKLGSKIDAESVLNQVSQKTASEIQSGKSEITMSLRPEGLGKVDINVVSEKGVITAQIVAENSQVKELLNNEIDSLKQKLQDQGINFDSVAVKVQEPAKANNDSSNFDQDLRKFNQPDQNDSNSSDFNSSKHPQNRAAQNDLNYDMSDLQSELDLKTELNSTEVHQGLVDYRI